MSAFSNFFSANRRSAQQYDQLIIALRAATTELRHANAGFTDLLCRLLPHLVRALEAEAGLIYTRTTEAPLSPHIQLLIAKENPEVVRADQNNNGDKESLPLAASEQVAAAAFAPYFAQQEAQIVNLEALAEWPTLVSQPLTSVLLATLATPDQEYLLLICNKDEQAGYPFVAADRTVLNFLLAVIGADIRAQARLQQEHNAVQTISQLVAQNRMEELWCAIVQNAAQLGKTKYAHIFAHEEDHHRLLSKCNWNAATQEEIEKGYALSLDTSSLNTNVAKTLQPIYLAEIADTPESSFARGEWEDDVRSAYCIPLVSQTQLVGTLYVASTEPDGISLEERQCIDRLAPHAAVALNTAKLLNQAQQTSELDNEIIALQQEVTDVLREDMQIEQIESMLAPYFSAEFNPFLALWNKYTGTIKLPFVHERGQKQVTADHPLYAERPIGTRHGLIDYMHAHQLDQLDIANFAEWDARAAIAPAYCDTLHCCLIFALHHRDELVGWIGFRGYQRPYMFDDRQRELLRRVAPHIATVLYNAHEYEQKINERDIISAFQTRISQLSDTEAAEIDQISTAVRETLGKLQIAATDMYIALYDEQTETITVPLVYVDGTIMPAHEREQDPIYQTRHIDRRLGFTEYILRHQTPILAKDRQILAQWQAKGVDVQPQFVCWMGVPMWVLNKIVGVMALRSTKAENLFEENHVDLLQVIANEAAITLENARQFEAAQTMLTYSEVLYETGRQISRSSMHDDNTILQMLVKRAKEVTGSHLSMLYQYEGEYLALQLLETDYEDGEYPNFISCQEKTIVTSALAANKAQLITDVTRPHDNHYRDILNGRTGSQIAVVIRAGADKQGELLGVISIEHPAINGLSKRERNFVIGLADLAAIAMQNAERDRAFRRNTAIALMGVWKAEISHAMNRYFGEVQTGIASLLIEEDLPEIVRDELDYLAEETEQMRTSEFYIGNIGELALENEQGQTNLHGALKTDIDHFCTEQQLNENEQKEIVRFQSNCPDVMVSIHHRWLRILINHYLHNAYRHHQSQDQPIIVETEQKQNLAIVYVKNIGNGIQQDVRDRLFEEPVEPTDKTSGRGLLLVRFICEQHRGQAWLRSRPDDQETCFAFSIPIIQHSTTTA